jgi:hypothetical protein
VSNPQSRVKLSLASATDNPKRGSSMRLGSHYEMRKSDGRRVVACHCTKYGGDVGGPRPRTPTAEQSAYQSELTALSLESDKQVSARISGVRCRASTPSFLGMTASWG